MRSLRIALLWLAGHLTGQTAPPLPDAGWQVPVGEKLPLDVPVRTTADATVPLRDYFDGHPVLLVLGYNRCPMLCSEQIQGVLQVTHELEWQPPEDFRILFFSVDADEPTEIAREAEVNANRTATGDPQAHAWTFLRGTPATITTLSQASGFRYSYVSATHDFAHPAGFVIAAPDGTLTHGFTGVRFEPATLRLALAEASQGKLGSLGDQIHLLCYRYDPRTGRYGLAIWRLLQVGALLTILALGLYIVRQLRRERPPRPRA